ncbi:MBL fold metallo-hydrolase [Halomarina oriensis]|nr:MBL fold metallo-hydrolase [Halomarina oriensis]
MMDNDSEDGTGGSPPDNHGGGPWQPPEANEQFDPLAHAGLEATTETPFVVVPRGGAREVGRSCYHVETPFSTFLIDCGLNQGSGGQFPDFRGLDREQIDAVFLTHAHIDHAGGLPVLENQGLLDDEAPILTTAPTAQIAHTMLEDSLKIHRREARRPGRSQQFWSQDVTDVCDRFEPVEYGTDRVEAYAPVSENDPTTFELGAAGHLLGSAWVALQTAGHSIVFSGDLGGRAGYLPDIAKPPSADALITESTYGNKHSHTSTSTAQSNLFEAIAEAVERGAPVLIPTFAVGRAQMILLLLQQRLHTLPGSLTDDVHIVLDGLAQEVTDLYHLHASDDSLFDESLVNMIHESGVSQPFLPDNVTVPDDDADRQRVFDAYDPVEGTNIPIIIAPSGMLTGGNSPRYLAELAARYDDAAVVLTGYQAVGTAGRALQSATRADGEAPTVTPDIDPITPPGDWPSATGSVGWVQEQETGDARLTITVPTEWITTVDGLSAHASQAGLLAFARHVSPDTIGLVHGPHYAQEALQSHLVENVETVDQVTRLAPLSPLAIHAETTNEMATKALEPQPSEQVTLDDQLDSLRETMTALSSAVAEDRNSGLTEAEVRAIVREELKRIQQ